jgi:two-component system OmpR family response regulator
MDRAQKRILVADDDPSLLDLISTRLDLAGYHCFVARDGLECLERLPEVRPAALVLDINMPRKDGFEVLGQMRRMASHLRVPTLILSARNRPDDVRDALALGARDYLAKPFKSELLLARVARLVRPAREREA